MPRKSLVTGLIHAMTKSEKRYFTLFSGLQKRENQYLNLFAELNSGKEEGGKGKASYRDSQQRKYLSEQILRALRLYNENLSPNIIIQNGLSEIEVLYEKRQGLYCQEKIKEVKTLADEFEKFGLQLQIYEWERKLKYILDVPERTENEISADENITLQNKLNVLNYERLFGTTLEFKKRYGFIKGKHLEELRRDVLEHPLMGNRHECRSSKALFFFLYGNTLCRWIFQDHIGAYEFSAELIDLNPKLIGDEEFFNGYLEHISSCVSMGYYDEVLRLLDRAKQMLDDKIIHSHPVLRTRLFYYKSNYTVLAYLNTGDRHKLEQTVAEVEREMQFYSPYINEEIKIIINSSLRNAYFFLGNYKKALEKMNDILLQANESFRKDVYEDTILFSLVYWLQMKESDLFESSLASARRYFNLQKKNVEQAYEFELGMVDVLKSVKNLEDPKSMENVWPKIENMILISSRQEGKNNYIEHLFPFLFWARSNERNTDYFDEAKNWYTKHLKAKKN